MYILTLKNFINLFYDKLQCKVIIMDKNKEIYNNYLDEIPIYRYLEELKIQSIYASDNNIIIEIIET